MELNIQNNQMEIIAGMSSEYPYTLHREYIIDGKVPWHWHEELEFNYILEGKAILHTINETYTFKKNQAYFTNSNVLSMLEGKEGCVSNAHLFHPTFLSGHFKSIFETKYINPVIQNRKIEVIEIRGETEAQRKILEKLCEAAKQQKKENTEFQIRNLFSEIWLLLMEEIQKKESGENIVASVNQERVLTMLSYIQRNYQKKITLEAIAKEASISKREALRCFQKCIQETPFEYLVGYRLEQAKKLLKSTNWSILEIAVETGFSNGTYFSKIFKRECGKTPCEYRKDVEYCTRKETSNATEGSE